MELRESSNIPVTPHEERGGDDWLYLPPSSQTNKKKRLTTQTRGQRDKQRKTIKLWEGEQTIWEKPHNLLFNYKH